MRGRAVVAAAVLAASVPALAACSTAAAGPPPGSGRPIEVVAAENVWGSIAAQVGGDRVEVTSIIDNPAADPHDYEPTAADARALAGARLVIVNGIGYDPWAAKLNAANPVEGRIVLTVGDLVGIKPGGNPHRWYSPSDVQRVVDAIAAAYARLDPKSAGYFRRQRAQFETKGLVPYRRLIAGIERRYSGVAVALRAQGAERRLRPLVRRGLPGHRSDDTGSRQRLDRENDSR